MKRFGVIFIIFAFAIIIFLIVQIMVSSLFGRVLRAVRDNEITAECIGKNVTMIKTKVIIIGSAIASIAGVLYSVYLQVVVAGAFKRTDWTFWPWLMVMLGGPGNNIGAFVGTLAVILARRTIIYYKYNLEAFIPFDVIWLEQIMLGVVLILIMMFRPQRSYTRKATTHTSIPTKEGTKTRISHLIPIT